MPRKIVPRGKKQNPTGRIKKQRIPVSDRANAEAEALAFKLGFINPRTGEGNRSELVEKAIAALSKSYAQSRAHHDEMITWLGQ